MARGGGAMPSGGAGVAWHVSWGAPAPCYTPGAAAKRPAVGKASRLGGCRTVRHRGAVFIVSG